MQALLICVSLYSVAATLFFGLKYLAHMDRFKPVLSLDEEAERVRKDTEKNRTDSVREIQQAKAEAAEAVSKAKAKAAALTQAYSKAKEIYDRLQREVSLLEATSEDMSFALYKPQYSFDTSEAYKAALEEIYEKKKSCIKGDFAAIYTTDWTVNNDDAEGERMIKKQVKIMLRAFNGECAATVARVNWNNLTHMIARIQKSFEAINSLGAVVNARISNSYLELCLAELKLTNEYEMKKQEEKEKACEERERMRKQEPAWKNTALRQKSADRSLTLVNSRKESFSVTLDEISEFAQSQGLRMEFVELPDARQLRESEAARLKALQAEEAPVEKEDAFPEQLFALLED